MVLMMMVLERLERPELATVPKPVREVQETAVVREVVGAAVAGPPNVLHPNRDNRHGLEPQRILKPTTCLRKDATGRAELAEAINDVGLRPNVKGRLSLSVVERLSLLVYAEIWRGNLGRARSWSVCAPRGALIPPTGRRTRPSRVGVGLSLHPPLAPPLPAPAPAPLVPRGRPSPRGRRSRAAGPFLPPRRQGGFSLRLLSLLQKDCDPVGRPLIRGCCGGADVADRSG